MIQLKPKEITAHVTIMVAVGLLLCTTAKASDEPRDLRNWEFKLIMPPYFTNYGLLTLRPNNSAQWGTVCDIDFTKDAALAACHSAGFNTITTASKTDKDQKDKTITNTGPIYVANVVCDPSVNDLRDCSYNAETQHCTHNNNDLWLMCGKNPETHVLDFKLVDEAAIGITGDPRVGRIKVKTMINGTYGDICGTSADNITATAACRTLRFDVTDAGKIDIEKNIELRDLKEVETTMNYLTCADKSGLKECTYKLNPENRWRTFCWSALVLDCHERHPDKWKFRIEESGTPGKGRLEMRPDEDKSWGSVCSNMFNDNSAMIMCKAAGYTDVTSARAILNYSSVSKPTTQSERPIYLTDVLCHQKSTSLSSCTYAYEPNGMPPSSVCTSITDVGIECSGTPPTLPKDTGGNGKPPAAKLPAVPKIPNAKSSSVPTSVPTEPTTTTAKPNWEYKFLLPSYFTNYGLLTLRPDNSAQWGTVCDKGFNDVSALAACRSLGFNNITTASLVVKSNKDREINNTGPIYMSNVNCDSAVDGPLLQNCKYSTSIEGCGHNNDVWLKCGKNAETHVFNFELVEEAATGITGELRVGRVKLQTVANGPYYDVCGPDFDKVASTAVCHTLGFDVIEAKKIEKRISKSHVVLNFLKCPAKISGLKECTYTLDPEDRFEYSAFHSETCLPLLLDCRGPLLPPSSGSATVPGTNTGGNGKAPNAKVPTKPEWEFELKKPQYFTNYGLLTIQPNSSGGTVCDKGFNDVSALTP